MRIASISLLTLIIACGSGRDVPPGTPGQQNNSGDSGAGGNDGSSIQKDGGSAGDANGFSDALTGCRDQFPAAQGPTAPCCPEWGIDACGAGLFCAAFDGRTQPVCYTERSRQPLETCSEDRHCSTESCNTTVNKCRSGNFDTCETDAGCVSMDYYCTLENQQRQCRPSSGEFGAPCRNSDICAEQLECEASTQTCRPPPGETCGTCDNGMCNPQGGPPAFCDGASNTCEPIGPNNQPAPCCATIDDCCPNGPNGCMYNQCFRIISNGVGACI